jgi:hypothetical protein
VVPVSPALAQLLLLADTKNANATTTTNKAETATLLIEDDAHITPSNVSGLTLMLLAPP